MYFWGVLCDKKIVVKNIKKFFLFKKWLGLIFVSIYKNKIVGLMFNMLNVNVVKIVEKRWLIEGWR